MKRIGGILIVGLFLSGCAAKGAAGRGHAAAEPQVYDRAVAAALVFDPPITHHEPELDLRRDVRQPAAFVGFDQLTTTFFYIRTDDRQTTDFFDRYDRQAISERVGVSHR